MGAPNHGRMLVSERRERRVAGLCTRLMRTAPAPSCLLPVAALPRHWSSWACLPLLSFRDPYGGPPSGVFAARPCIWFLGAHHHCGPSLLPQVKLVSCRRLPPGLIPLIVNSHGPWPPASPMSPSHHPALSRARYLVPVHCFELWLHHRVCLLSVRGGHRPVLHGTLGREEKRGLPIAAREENPEPARDEPGLAGAECGAGWAEIEGTEFTWKRVCTDVGSHSWHLSSPLEIYIKARGRKVQGRREAGKETGRKRELSGGAPWPRGALPAPPQAPGSCQARSCRVAPRGPGRLAGSRLLTTRQTSLPGESAGLVSHRRGV